VDGQIIVLISEAMIHPGVYFGDLPGRVNLDSAADKFEDC